MEETANMAKHTVGYILKKLPNRLGPLVFSNGVTADTNGRMNFEVYRVILCSHSEKYYTNR